MSIIPKTWHSSWNAFMTESIIEELKEIESKIGKNIYPEEKNVLRFLNNDLNNVKCIIVGMDPYPSSFSKNGKEIPIATGRSFEVQNIENWQQKFKQSSLRNILKTIYYNKTGQKKSMEELRDMIEKKEFCIKQPKEWFDSLENQGVLFLNASLTVEPGKPDSHRKIWNKFMTKLIKYISQNKNIKWLLWGDKAKTRVLPIIDESTAIISQHPRLDGFVKENCFKEIKEINWYG